MHKRLATDLMSLAHEILQMKNKEDVFALKEKAKEIYEKLSVLAFVEEYVTTTPNSSKIEEQLKTTIEVALKNKTSLPESIEKKDQQKTVNQVDVKSKKEVLQPIVEEKIEQPFDELEKILSSEKEEKFEPTKTEEIIFREQKTATLEDELQDTISIDVAANLFDVPTSKSLNDKLAGTITIGLNDRIAFVKQLFNGSQEDYNRVVSQLNTFKTAKDAKKFIGKMVKPEYNWESQEELETRFMEIIERRFV